MSAWRLWIGIVLLLHGIGHLLGVLAVTSLGPENWNARSWLLTDTIGEGPSKVLSTVLWALCLILIVAGGLALLEVGLGESLWKPLIVTGSVLSLVTLAIFWNGFPVLFPNKIGAIAVDVVALVGILMADWPSAEMLAS